LLLTNTHNNCFFSFPHCIFVFQASDKRPEVRSGSWKQKS